MPEKNIDCATKVEPPLAERLAGIEHSMHRAIYQKDIIVNKLFYDMYTNDLPCDPSSDKNQPGLIELACILEAKMFDLANALENIANKL